MHTRECVSLPPSGQKPGKETRLLKGVGTGCKRHLQDAYCTELQGDNKPPEICP